MNDALLLVLSDSVIEGDLVGDRGGLLDLSTAESLDLWIHTQNHHHEKSTLGLWGTLTGTPFPILISPCWLLWTFRREDIREGLLFPW